MRKLFILLLLALPLLSEAQQLRIAGTVYDTTANKPLKYAVAMAVRVKDSTLVGFTRSNEQGRFELNNLAIDTVEVTISSPKFGDLHYYVFANTATNEFDFGRIILPPKSVKLNEVVIFADKDPIHYRGDTLVFLADSFKVKANATVEDLLKKLPGMKVDAQGKITSQGKTIDQVLVDGDEFFGADPTIATKNLNARSVEAVEVYEKKTDNTASNETTQVLNLKLKDDAKKGYFGKVSGASDFDKFYESEVLANRFTSTKKFSVYGLASNTPRSGLGWQDANKYGISNEMNSFTNEDGMTYFYQNNNQNAAIPRTVKSGIYYNEKIGKRTKLGINYSYGRVNANSRAESSTQYFLTDTTYKNNTNSQGLSTTETHAVNLNLEQKLDSLSTLTINSKLKYNPSKQNNGQSNNFISEEDSLIRRSTINNLSKGGQYNWLNSVKLQHNFMKKDRQFNANYSFTLDDNSGTGYLYSKNIYFQNSGTNDSINQKKEFATVNRLHFTELSFIEPITPKIKIETGYDFSFSNGTQVKKTLDFQNGEYNNENQLYTNSFENTRMTNRWNLKFIYEVKKQRLSIGTRYRIVDIQNVNQVTQQNIDQHVKNILPYLGYRYKLNDNSTVNFDYSTSSNQPTITQLQPVPDNTNPNSIRVGNPNLLPNFTHRYNSTFNMYKPVSGRYIWANASFSNSNRDFTNSVVYDSIGRTSTQTINVDGNYNFYTYLNMGLPFFDQALSLEPSLNFNAFKNQNFINYQKNTTRQSNVGGGLEIALRLEEFECEIGNEYNYSKPTSTLNAENNQAYAQQEYYASLRWDLPFKFRIETDANYYIYSKRAPGFNSNFIIWNALIARKFLKNENLILSIDATDLLNKNINNTRTVQDNVITDTRNSIIRRYVLFKLTYKFNSTKTKDENDDDY